MKLKATLFFCLSLLFVNHPLPAVQYDYITLLVNDRPITKNEIDIRAFETARALTGKQPNAETIKEYRKEATEQLIEEALLEVQADELMILISDEELDAEIERFQAQRNMNQLEFEDLLERQKISLADFRKTYKRQLRRNRVILREVRSAINIDEDALKAEYEQNAEFEMMVRARHILLLVGNNASPEKVDQVKQNAIELRKRIVSGESFSQIADLHSEDPSVKNNHGDLGFFKQGDMVKEFSDAAFSLDPGEISEPVRSDFGFHLIEVLEKKRDSKEPFESVKDTLLQKEYEKRFKEKYEQYVKNLKENAQIISK